MWRIGGNVTQRAEGVARRSFLQVGSLGVGGATLADLARLQAATSGNQTSTTRGKNVILFWLSGGPGHMETYDPKPDAVDQYRGPFGAINTALPGVQFGELCPQQAKLAQQLAVLRTVSHGSGDHTKSNHWMLTGFEGPAFNAPDFKLQRRPSMGSAVARLRGPNRPGMPPYVAVPHLRGGTDNFFHYATYLGPGVNPLSVESDPNTPEFKVKDLSLFADLTLERLEDRRLLRTTLGDLGRQVDALGGSVDPHYQRAFSLLSSREVSTAFDISAEQPALRDRYGRHTFGQSALLARRLTEAGVTFVTVNCVPWDHHGSPGQYRTEEGAKLLIPPLDQAVAALVNDLIERGLYDDTLVVVMGEFGRTPKMNANAGRDHWGHTFSVVMGCGSLRMGQTIGRSDDRGEYVSDRLLTPQDVTATIFKHLGIDAPQVVFRDAQLRPSPLVESGAPIRELFG
ncbi:MAG: DUF1501 domain-containing protein [Planctomycetaceae bacterium]|nr:DUF1501 domain-containing protein [Planctomycetaceae bacterium]